MDSTQKEEILLDENKDSYGFEFYMTHGVETSPDHKRIAYAVDTSGGEKYTLHVKELESGKELLKTPIKVATKACCWLIFVDNAVHLLLNVGPAHSPVLLLEPCFSHVPTSHVRYKSKLSCCVMPDQPAIAQKHKFVCQSVSDAHAHIAMLAVQDIVMQWQL